MDTKPRVREEQMIIAEQGDLDPLIKLLRHSDEKIRNKAATIINSLTIVNTDDVVFKSETSPRHLIELANDSDPEVQAKSMWSLAILADFEPNQRTIINNMGVENILALVRGSYVEVQCAAITLLGNLALNEAGRNRIIEIAGHKTLTKLLGNTRDIIVKRAVISALSNIVDADNANETVNNDLLSQLLGLMQSTDDERVLSGVLRTLSHIANSEDDDVNALIAKRGLKRLINLLNSSDLMVAKASVMTLNGLTSRDYDIQKRVMVDGGVDNLMDLLEDYKEDPEMTLGIVMTMNNLSQNKDLRSGLKSRGIVDLLSDTFVSSGDRNIKHECAEVLKSLSPGKAINLESWGRGRRTQRSETMTLRDGIKQNVRKIINVLIEDPSKQDRLRESGVIPHLLTLLVEENKDLELKGLALDAITMMCINNNHSQLAVCDGEEPNGLNSVYKLIMDPEISPHVQLRAVRCLGALCWGNKTIQGSLLEHEDIIKYLVSLIDTYDNTLKRVVLTTIASIVDDYPGTQRAVHKFGGDQKLVNNIEREQEPDQMVAAAAAALGSLCKGNFKNQNSCKKSVPCLIFLLESGSRKKADPIVLEHLTGALFEFSRDNPEIGKHIWKNEVSLPLFINILKSSESTQNTLYHTIGILWELSRKKSFCKALSNNGDLSSVIPLLCNNETALIRDAAQRLLQHLTH
eukprot:TRINITY_DN6142_c0_g1_i1.p1 TRINITY_DN6142_c0_g1~~TRINITY_DN6142_c0_g1_i1.p1  ORF type:complete len:690 (+),score=126.14 TRINITY_DN6142_c0_g1_i1:1653-3722(+)